MNFLFSAIDPDYKHEVLFGKGAIFDLEPHQHGWDLISEISVGDFAAVIRPSRKIPLLYEVTSIDKQEKRIVVFGKPIERIDQAYDTFVRKNEIKSPKLSSSNMMLQGFNVAVW